MSIRSIENKLKFLLENDDTLFARRNRTFYKEFYNVYRD
jgi:hypothetical protein